ncbi:TagK domain-containing protein [Curvibacter gracilis]|uniref:TagK domain-containing protein n=1 Tax=Curvibacter gracilis TaxID=230310 RepID=UPI0012FC4E81
MPHQPPSAAPSLDTFELTDLWAPPSPSTQNDGPTIHDNLSAPLAWPDHNSPAPATDVATQQGLSDLENNPHTPAHLLLGRLHQAYWQYIRQPHAPPDAQDWSKLLAAAPSDKGAMEDLTHRAANYESLYTLLGDRVAIDDVMAGLDPLGAQDLLQPDPPVSVLHLFAPPMTAPDEATLPTLTLREHHVVTADSALPPPAYPPRQPEARPTPPGHSIGAPNLPLT